MENTAQIALTIDGERVRGTVEFDGLRTAFQGWLELMTLVDELRRDAAPTEQDREA